MMIKVNVVKGDMFKMVIKIRIKRDANSYRIKDIVKDR